MQCEAPGEFYHFVESARRSRSQATAWSSRDRPQQQASPAQGAAASCACLPKQVSDCSTGTSTPGECRAQVPEAEGWRGSGRQNSHPSLPPWSKAETLSWPRGAWGAGSSCQGTEATASWHSHRASLSTLCTSQAPQRNLKKVKVKQTNADAEGKKHKQCKRKEEETRELQLNSVQLLFHCTHRNSY